MQSTFYLSCCLLSWGLATFSMKLVGSRLDPISIAVFNVAGYMAAGLFLLPHARLQLSPWHGLAALIGVLFVLGNMAFYKLSQTAKVSTLAPLTGLYIAVPVLLGILVLGESLTPRRGAGILLALVALYLLSSSDG